MSADSKNPRLLSERVGDDPEGLKELTLAARRFRTAARRDHRLKTLLLVDPLRAFRDAGIDVSKHARKTMRRVHPELAFDNDALYERVKQHGLTWVKEIDLGPGVSGQDRSARE